MLAPRNRRHATLSPRGGRGLYARMIMSMIDVECDPGLLRGVNQEWTVQLLDGSLECGVVLYGSIGELITSR